VGCGYKQVGHGWGFEHLVTSTDIMIIVLDTVLPLHLYRHRRKNGHVPSFDVEPAWDS
jgi:hypothetical protein